MHTPFRPHARTLARTTVAAAAMAVAGAATAGTIERRDFQTGAAFCTGALPVYDHMLRKRPRGISNEGNAPAFVTCALAGENSTWVDVAVVGITNPGTAPVQVTCTLTDGDRTGGLSVTRTFTIPNNPDMVYAVSFDKGQDNAGMPFAPAIGFSCILPPGTVLASTQKWYTETSEP